MPEASPGVEAVAAVLLVAAAEPVVLVAAVELVAGAIVSAGVALDCAEEAVAVVPELADGLLRVTRYWLPPEFCPGSCWIVNWICDPFPDWFKKLSSAFRSCSEKEFVESVDVVPAPALDVFDVRESTTTLDGLVVKETMAEKVASADKKGNSPAKHALPGPLKACLDESESETPSRTVELPGGR